MSLHPSHSRRVRSAASVEDVPTWLVVATVTSRVFPPPVLAALLGMVVALLDPVRGLFVDLEDRNGDAVLQWVFVGMKKIGQAAVPINMFILGNSLMKGANRNSIPLRTVVAVAIGK